MDIQRLWNLPDPADTEPIALARGAGASQHPLVRLQRALRWNIGYGVVITAAMCVLLAQAGEWPLILAFGIVTAFCAWAVWDTWRLLKGLDTVVSASRTTLEELRRQRTAFDGWMRTQQRVGWFIYPVSAIGGGLWGATVGAGESLAQLSHKTSFLVVIALLAVVMSPLCAWGAKWMFRQAFGRHVDRLRELIVELEA